MHSICSSLRTKELKFVCSLKKRVKGTRFISKLLLSYCRKVCPPFTCFEMSFNTIFLQTRNSTATVQRSKLFHRPWFLTTLSTVTHELFSKNTEELTIKKTAPTPTSNQELVRIFQCWAASGEQNSI